MQSDHHIKSLVVQLEHGSLAEQQDAARRLTEGSWASYRQVVLDLPKLNSRGRLALLCRLGELRDEQLLTPLMRYVFATRDDLAEADGRAIAMKALVEIVTEAEAGRVGQFAADIADDRDVFVRGYAVVLLARTTGPNAQDFIDAALSDEDPVVREQAIRAQASLQRGDFYDSAIQMDPATLLTHIRGSSGAALEKWLARLRRHPSAAALAAQLVKERAHRTRTGLLLLFEFDDANTRAVVREHLQWTTCAEEKALCLRILATQLNNDASHEELNSIRLGLSSDDDFILVAAWNAAGRTGDADLITRTIHAATDSNSDVAFAAADSLARSLQPDHWNHVGQLDQALEIVHRRGVSVSGLAWVQLQKLEMLLAIALARVVGVEKTGDTIRAIRRRYPREVDEVAKARNLKAWNDELVLVRPGHVTHDSAIVRSCLSETTRSDVAEAMKEIALVLGRSEDD